MYDVMKGDQMKSGITMYYMVVVGDVRCKYHRHIGT